MSSPIPTPNGKRLLVADDAALSRKLLASTLSAIGYQVDVAEDGEQAVAMVSEAGYAAVLLDCQMPRLDGYQATARIRRMPPPTGGLPIIGLTAALAADERDRCLQAGMNEMLPKPVDPAALQAALSLHLGRPAPDAEAAAIQRGVLDHVSKFPGGEANELLQELVAIYMEEAPAMLAQIRTAIAGADAEGLRQAAHNLKGCSSNMGLSTLAALCEGLERRGRDGALGGAEALSKRLEREFERVMAALAAMGA